MGFMNPANEFYDSPHSGDIPEACSTATVADALRPHLFPRPVCLVHDRQGSEPESQVDRLIADLMDIIVRAATGSSTESTAPRSSEAMAEVVALSMMQGLLDKGSCYSV